MQRKVTSVSEGIKLTAARQPERWVTVEYTLDALGPFTFESPKKDFSWDAVKKAMDANEQGLKSVSS